MVSPMSRRYIAGPTEVHVDGNCCGYGCDYLRHGGCSLFDVPDLPTALMAAPRRLRTRLCLISEEKSRDELLERMREALEPAE